MVVSFDSSTLEEWRCYVDEVIGEEKCPCAGDERWLPVFRKGYIGEYEIGVTPEQFKELLKNLREGDVVVFTFKSLSRWFGKFANLVNAPNSCFVFLEKGSTIPFNHIHNLAGSMLRMAKEYTVRCRVVDQVGKFHDINWLSDHLGICLKSVSVEKPGDP